LKIIIKVISYILAIFIALVLLILFLNLQNTLDIHNNSEQNKNNISNLTAYNLSDSEIIIDTNQNNNGIGDIDRENILNRAKDMVTISWIPKYNLLDSVGHYIFLKGKRYNGIPYILGGYQVSSSNDFLSHMNKSDKLYGNDCSGFVSIAWGVSRQTTLSLYNAAKYGNKIDGKSVAIIPWEELKPGDALLLDNGYGKGHILLFINFDPKNNNSVNVYEQNVATLVPFQPVPTAREDIRSKRMLEMNGYIPIRLI